MSRNEFQYRKDVAFINLEQELRKKVLDEWKYWNVSESGDRRGKDFAGYLIALTGNPGEN